MGANWGGCIPCSLLRCGCRQMVERGSEREEGGGEADVVVERRERERKKERRRGREREREKLQKAYQNEW